MRSVAPLLLFCLLALPAGAQPTPDRPSDDLLSRPDVQAVVEAQVDRDRAALIDALDADVPAVRARAAFALASVPDTSAIPALLSLLTDGVPLVRTDAAFALAQMPGGVPADRLLEVLRYERDEAMQRRLIAALGRTGDAASQDALLALGLPAPRAPDVALALAHYGMRGHADAGAAAWLVEHLTAESAAARRHAAYALGRVEALASGRADTIRHALDGYASGAAAAQHLIRALGRLDDPADTGRLVDWLRSGTDWRVRVEAARALGGLDTAAARTALVQALDDDHPLVARAAAETLAGADWPAGTQTAVGVWLDAHPDRWRVGAPLLKGWARNGPPGRVRRTLRRWRDDPSPFAAAAALPALAPIEKAWADSLLAAASRADDPRVAAAAVRGLATRWDRLRPKQADRTFRLLSAAVRRGDPALLYHGAPVLTDSLFVARGATDTLAAAYRTLTLPADLEGMTATLEALATIGDAKARTVLRGALDHPHPAVRRTAAEGLSSITDSTVAAARRPLPETMPIDWDTLRALGPAPRLVLETTQGTVVLELDAEQAPQTVQAICRFARAGRYDGVPFHRVVPNFVVQGGDVARRDGFGGPEVFLRTEITRIGHRRGTVGMASAGRDTEGSQFFVPHSLQPRLDGAYTAFGRVVRGLDVVDRLRVGDRIEDATVRPTN
ncbi:MAG: peptidylprolyl isomerase [Salinibacter sp.]